MNFENLQKDLFERKLNLGEYFGKKISYGLFCLHLEMLGCFFQIY